MFASGCSVLALLTGGDLAAAQERTPAPVLVLVVARPAEDLDFARAVDAAVRFHGAALLETGAAPSRELLPALRELAPRRVLVFVPAAQFDAALHRRLFALARAVDDDPFVDFEFGYMTASDGPALLALWRRTEAFHASGPRSARWNEVMVATGIESLVYGNHVPRLAELAGFSGDGVCLGVVESDPNVLAFAARELVRLDGSAVVSFTGNGDPQGVWLFDGRRNLDRDAHWDYAPDRVGSDPDGVMPRLLAADVRRRDLSGAVVWSGTCHSAVTRRAVVEGDIVSTFGRTSGRVIHELPPDESLCLAFQGAGAVALLAPVGANHGFAVDVEQDFALRHGATLGAVIASTWDDVVLAANGSPRLADPFDAVEGEDEDVMAAGGANRVLIGDPALAPFRAVSDACERVAVTREGDRLVVDVAWEAGFEPRAWDMYGSDRERDGRITARVEVVCGAASLEIASAAVSVEDSDGGVLPFVLGPCLVEDEPGFAVLHLCARAARESIGTRALRARFTLELAHDSVRER
jgi:hypothetical protein